MKLLAAALAAILFLSSPAVAKVLCGPRAAIVAGLKKDYAEYPVSMGPLQNGNLLEIFVSKAGSFTIVVTKPKGLSCLMTWGKNWEDLPEQKKDIGI